MESPITIIIFVISSLTFEFCVSDFALNTVVVPAEYDKNYQRFANSTIEYIFLYNEIEKISLEGAKIFVESEEATIDDPLIVVVKQKRGTLSWQIPMYVEDDHGNVTLYRKTSRNLCPAKYYHSLKGHSGRDEEPEIFVFITVSTTSKTSISFNLTLLPVLDFYLKSGDSRNVTISPFEPVYYGHIFDSNSSNVLVTVESYNGKTDKDCMTLAIAPTLCPVFDYQGNRHVTGMWQTVTLQGAITVSNEEYPHGFFIVLLVDPDVKTCSAADVDSNRQKNVTLKVSNGMPEIDYLLPTIVPLLIFVGFCIFYVISALSCKMHIPPSFQFESFLDENKEVKGPDENEDAIDSINDVTDHVSSNNVLADENAINRIGDSNPRISAMHDRISLNDSGDHIAYVRDLLTKEIKILRKNSHQYLYYLIIIGTFYALPVMQLVGNYEKMLRVTGNQNLCYYNFLCSHPLLIFTDFNHIFSNFAYVLLGLLFIFIVYMRERNDTLSHENANKKNPRQYGLFYAMGFASMMEGLLSASYHVCPNHDNFQFDTSFMYIISVLCMMKLYQNRHPGITAEAHVTFSAIAITVILALAGIAGDNNQNFWICFTVIHFSFCFLLSVKIYYMKGWRSVGRKLMETAKAVRTGIRIHIAHPYYPKRLCLIIVGNVFNISLAITGILKYETVDFPTYLLAIFMMNLLIYLTYYIIMKIRHGEKILLKTQLHIILAVFCWGAAVYFFRAQRLSFSDTPAVAREKNHSCLLWDFYDFHDIWHFLSALAMFFSFMMMFTIDDDLPTCNNDVF